MPLGHHHSTEESLQKAAEVLYDQNLTTLLDKYRLGLDGPRSVWKVDVDESGIIIDCTRCKRVQRPHANSFLFIVPGNGKYPVFGSFNALEGHQLGVASQMKADLAKLFQTIEIAYCISKGKVDAFVGSAISRHVSELSKRFGELPAPCKQIAKEQAWAESLDLAAKRAESKTIIESIPRDIFERFVATEFGQNGKGDVKQLKRREIAVPARRKASMVAFKVRYFSFHYRVNNRRYQFLQVYN